MCACVLICARVFKCDTYVYVRVCPRVSLCAYVVWVLKSRNGENMHAEAVRLARQNYGTIKYMQIMWVHDACVFCVRFTSVQPNKRRFKVGREVAGGLRNGAHLQGKLRMQQEQGEAPRMLAHTHMHTHAHTRTRMHTHAHACTQNTRTLCSWQC